MKTPRMTIRLTLEQQISAPDGAGGETEDWVVVADHHAALTVRGATEGESGARRFGAVTYKAIIRYVAHGAADRPRPDQRFRDGERIFNILGVADADDRRQWLTCWLEEGAPA